MEEPSADEVVARLIAIADGLVPRRTCGGCTACCEFLLIDTAELRKPAGVLCEHCTGSGCALHGSPRRPSLCGTFHCVWRRWDGLRDDIRPDRSGALVSFRIERQHANYFRRLCFLVVLTDTPIALYELGLQEDIQAVIAECRVPVFAVCNGIEVMIYPDEALADAVSNGGETLYPTLVEAAGAWRRRYEAVLACAP